MMFFEMEMQRLERCIDSLLNNSALNPSKDDVLNLDMTARGMKDYLKSCYRSQELQNQIAALKKQLRKLHRETSKFERSLSLSSMVSGTPRPLAEENQRRAQSIDAGRRIRSRVEEMCDILDDKANECKGAIDNTSITMQTLWSHFASEDNQRSLHFSRVSTDLANTNKELAEAMQNDSSQMRSIAMLTMVFLPISTVSVSTCRWICCILQLINRLVDLLNESIYLECGSWRTDSLTVYMDICCDFIVINKCRSRFLGCGDALCE